MNSLALGRYDHGLRFSFSQAFSNISFFDPFLFQSNPNLFRFPFRTC